MLQSAPGRGKRDKMLPICTKGTTETCYNSYEANSRSDWVLNLRPRSTLKGLMSTSGHCLSADQCLATSCVLCWKW